MEHDLFSKYAELQQILRDAGSAAIAFSGGVDSTFLLAAALKTEGVRAIPVTVLSETVPAHDREEVSVLCRTLGAELVLREMAACSIDGVRENPPDRCYHCKRATFAIVREEAERLGLDAVFDGSNHDDLADYRPGKRAMQELGVRSPLQEAALTKQEIRTLSKEMGLPTWNRPAAACLASRVPYGEKITPEKLSRIDRAEQFLSGLGVHRLRVRLHGGDLARIEVDPAEMSLVQENRDTILSEFRALGIRYITLDLQGYRMGSLNESLHQ